MSVYDYTGKPPIVPKKLRKTSYKWVKDRLWHFAHYTPTDPTHLAGYAAYFDLNAKFIGWHEAANKGNFNAQFKVAHHLTRLAKEITDGQINLAKLSAQEILPILTRWVAYERDDPRD